MAATMGHDRRPREKNEDEEEEEDPVETMLKKTGCMEFHYKLQDCMAEKKDWRECKKEVDAFKDCMISNHQQRFQNS